MSQPTNDAAGFYEEGKHRRYELLFKVNGGAFAIATLLRPAGDKILSGLRLWHVSAGMALLTTVLTADIFAFGIKMNRKDAALFKWQGRLVLFLIGLLLTAAWVHASFGGLQEFAYIAGYVAFVVVVSALTDADSRDEGTHWLKSLVFGRPEPKPPGGN